MEISNEMIHLQEVQVDQAMAPDLCQTPREFGITVPPIGILNRYYCVKEQKNSLNR